MNIERDKERIDQTGEVFTPTVLVNKMLDELPVNSFIDPTKTFCDPSCGDGQFLVEVLKRKLDNGASLYQASSTISGVDLMKDNIELCKKRLRAILMDYMENSGRGRKLNGGINDNINKNIICSDGFFWDYENWCLMPEEQRRIDNEAIKNNLIVY